MLYLNGRSFSLRKIAEVNPILFGKANKNSLVRQRRSSTEHRQGYRTFPYLGELQGKERRRYISFANGGGCTAVLRWRKSSLWTISGWHRYYSTLKESNLAILR